MKFFVYFNLHMGGYSLRSEETRLVVNKGVLTKKVCLKNVKFKISQKGRSRVLREKSKNVHAGAVGELQKEETIEGLIPIGYDPYRNPDREASFYRKDTGEDVVEAKLLIMNVNENGRPIVMAKL